MKRKKPLSVRISEIAILAAMYVAIGLFVLPISFGLLQARMSDALYPAIVIFGREGVIGLFLGHLIFNCYGYITGFALGPLDLLSPFIFIIPKLLIEKYGIKAVPIHILFVAGWVSTMLNILYKIPIPLGFLLVGIGELFAEGVGLILFDEIKWRLNK